MQDAVPKRVLPFIRVWDTSSVAEDSCRAWVASGGRNVLVCKLPCRMLLTFHAITFDVC